ncbi:MAG: hypothetical protein GY730_00345, partial [bacterium]|nr:hypothetical protein [bacterium]
MLASESGINNNLNIATPTGVASVDSSRKKPVDINKAFQETLEFVNEINADASPLVQNPYVQFKLLEYIEQNKALTASKKEKGIYTRFVEKGFSGISPSENKTILLFLKNISNPAVASKLGLSKEHYQLIKDTYTMASKKSDFSVLDSKSNTNYAKKIRKYFLQQYNITPEEMNIRNKTHLINADSTEIEYIYNNIDKYYQKKGESLNSVSEEDLANKLMDYIQKNFKYQDDTSDVNGKIKDHWQSIKETVLKKGGDCEDLSILTASLLMHALKRKGSSNEKVSSMVKLTTGSVTNSYVKNAGHIFVKFELSGKNKTKALDFTAKNGVADFKKYVKDIGFDTIAEFNNDFFKKYREINKGYTTAIQIGDQYSFTSNANRINDLFADLLGGKNKDSNNTAREGKLDQVFNTPKLYKDEAYRRIYEEDMADIADSDIAGLYKVKIRDYNGKKIEEIVPASIKSRPELTSSNQKIYRKVCVGEKKEDFSFFSFEKREIKSDMAPLDGSSKYHHVYVAKINKEKFHSYINETRDIINTITFLFHITNARLERVESVASEIYSYDSPDSRESEKKAKKKIKKQRSKFSSAINGFQERVASAIQQSSDQMINYIDTLNESQFQKAYFQAENWGRDITKSQEDPPATNAGDYALLFAKFAGNLLGGTTIELLDSFSGAFTAIREDHKKEIAQMKCEILAENAAAREALAQEMIDRIQLWSKDPETTNKYDVSYWDKNTIAMLNPNIATNSVPNKKNAKDFISSVTSQAIDITNDSHDSFSAGNATKFLSQDSTDAPLHGPSMKRTDRSGFMFEDKTLFNQAQGGHERGGDGAFIDFNMEKSLMFKEYMLEFQNMVRTALTTKQIIWDKIRYIFSQIGGEDDASAPNSPNILKSATNQALEIELSKQQNFFSRLIDNISQLAVEGNNLIAARFASAKAYIDVGLKSSETAVNVIAAISAPSIVAPSSVTSSRAAVMPVNILPSGIIATTPTGPVYSTNPLYEPSVENQRQLFEQYYSYLYTSGVSVRTSSVMASARLTMENSMNEWIYPQILHHNSKRYSEEKTRYMSNNLKLYLKTETSPIKNLFKRTADSKSSGKYFGNLMESIALDARLNFMGKRHSSTFNNSILSHTTKAAPPEFILDRYDGKVAIDYIKLGQRTKATTNAHNKIRAYLIIIKAIYEKIEAILAEMFNSPKSGAANKFENQINAALDFENQVIYALKEEINTFMKNFNKSSDKDRAVYMAGKETILAAVEEGLARSATPFSIHTQQAILGPANFYTPMSINPGGHYGKGIYVSSQTGKESAAISENQTWGAFAGLLARKFYKQRRDEKGENNTLLSISEDSDRTFDENNNDISYHSSIIAPTIPHSELSIKSESDIPKVIDQLINRNIVSLATSKKENINSKARKLAPFLEMDDEEKEVIWRLYKSEEFNENNELVSMDSDEQTIQDMDALGYKMVNYQNVVNAQEELNRIFVVRVMLLIIQKALFVTKQKVFQEMFGSVVSTHIIDKTMEQVDKYNEAQLQALSEIVSEQAQRVESENIAQQAEIAAIKDMSILGAFITLIYGGSLVKRVGIKGGGTSWLKNAQKNVIAQSAIKNAINIVANATIGLVGLLSIKKQTPVFKSDILEYSTEEDDDIDDTPEEKEQKRKKREQAKEEQSASDYGMSDSVTFAANGQFVANPAIKAKIQKRLEKKFRKIELLRQVTETYADNLLDELSEIGGVETSRAYKKISGLLSTFKRTESMALNAVFQGIQQLTSQKNMYMKNITDATSSALGLLSSKLIEKKIERIDKKLKLAKGKDGTSKYEAKRNKAKSEKKKKEYQAEIDKFRKEKNAPGATDKTKTTEEKKLEQSKRRYKYLLPSTLINETIVEAIVSSIVGESAFRLDKWADVEEFADQESGELSPESGELSLEGDENTNQTSSLNELEDQQLMMSISGKNYDTMKGIVSTDTDLYKKLAKKLKNVTFGVLQQAYNTRRTADISEKTKSEIAEKAILEKKGLENAAQKRNFATKALLWGASFFLGQTYINAGKKRTDNMAFSPMNMSSEFAASPVRDLAEKTHDEARQYVLSGGDKRKRKGDLLNPLVMKEIQESIEKSITANQKALAPASAAGASAMQYLNNFLEESKKQLSDAAVKAADRGLVSPEALARHYRAATQGRNIDDDTISAISSNLKKYKDKRGFLTDEFYKLSEDEKIRLLGGNDEAIKMLKNIDGSIAGQEESLKEVYSIAKEIQNQLNEKVAGYNQGTGPSQDLIEKLRQKELAQDIDKQPIAENAITIDVSGTGNNIRGKALSKEERSAVLNKGDKVPVPISAGQGNNSVQYTLLVSKKDLNKGYFNPTDPLTIQQALIGSGHSIMATTQKKSKSINSINRNSLMIDVNNIDDDQVEEKERLILSKIASLGLSEKQAQLAYKELKAKHLIEQDGKIKIGKKKQVKNLLINYLALPSDLTENTVIDKSFLTKLGMTGEEAASLIQVLKNKDIIDDHKQIKNNKFQNLRTELLNRSGHLDFNVVKGHSFTKQDLILNGFSQEDAQKLLPDNQPDNNMPLVKAGVLDDNNNLHSLDNEALKDALVDAGVNAENIDSLIIILRQSLLGISSASELRKNLKEKYGNKFEDALIVSEAKKDNLIISNYIGSLNNLIASFDQINALSGRSLDNVPESLPDIFALKPADKANLDQIIAKIIPADTKASLTKFKNNTHNLTADDFNNKEALLENNLLTAAEKSFLRDLGKLTEKDKVVLQELIAEERNKGGLGLSAEDLFELTGNINQSSNLINLLKQMSIINDSGFSPDNNRVDPNRVDPMTVFIISIKEISKYEKGSPEYNNALTQALNDNLIIANEDKTAAFNKFNDYIQTKIKNKTPEEKKQYLNKLASIQNNLYTQNNKTAAIATVKRSFKDKTDKELSINTNAFILDQLSKESQRLKREQERKELVARSKGLGGARQKKLKEKLAELEDHNSPEAEKLKASLKKQIEDDMLKADLIISSRLKAARSIDTESYESIMDRNLWGLDSKNKKLADNAIRAKEHHINRAALADEEIKSFTDKISNVRNIVDGQVRSVKTRKNSMEKYIESGISAHNQYIYSSIKHTDRRHQASNLIQSGARAKQALLNTAIEKGADTAAQDLLELIKQGRAGSSFAADIMKRLRYDNTEIFNKIIENTQKMAIQEKLDTQLASFVTDLSKDMDYLKGTIGGKLEKKSKTGTLAKYTTKPFLKAIKILPFVSTISYAMESSELSDKKLHGLTNESTGLTIEDLIKTGIYTNILSTIDEDGAEAEEFARVLNTMNKEQQRKIINKILTAGDSDKENRAKRTLLKQIFKSGTAKQVNEEFNDMEQTAISALLNVENDAGRDYILNKIDEFIATESKYEELKIKEKIESAVVPPAVLKSQVISGGFEENKDSSFTDTIKKYQLKITESKNKEALSYELRRRKLELAKIFITGLTSNNDNEREETLHLIKLVGTTDGAINEQIGITMGRILAKKNEKEVILDRLQQTIQKQLASKSLTEENKEYSSLMKTFNSIIRGAAPSEELVKQESAEIINNAQLIIKTDRVIEDNLNDIQTILASDSGRKILPDVARLIAQGLALKSEKAQKALLSISQNLNNNQERYEDFIAELEKAAKAININNDKLSDILTEIREDDVRTRRNYSHDHPIDKGLAILHLSADRDVQHLSPDQIKIEIQSSLFAGKTARAKKLFKSLVMSHPAMAASYLHQISQGGPRFSPADAITLFKETRALIPSLSDLDLDTLKNIEVFTASLTKSEFGKKIAQLTRDANIALNNLGLDVNETNTLALFIINNEALLTRAGEGDSSAIKTLGEKSSEISKATSALKESINLYNNTVVSLKNELATLESAQPQNNHTINLKRNNIRVTEQKIKILMDQVERMDALKGLCDLHLLSQLANISMQDYELQGKLQSEQSFDALFNKDAIQDTVVNLTKATLPADSIPGKMALDSIDNLIGNPGSALNKEIDRLNAFPDAANQNTVLAGIKQELIKLNEQLKNPEDNKPLIEETIGNLKSLIYKRNILSSKNRRVPGNLDVAELVNIESISTNLDNVILSASTIIRPQQQMTEAIAGATDTQIASILKHELDTSVIQTLLNSQALYEDKLKLIIRLMEFRNNVAQNRQGIISSNDAEKLKSDYDLDFISLLYEAKRNADPQEIFPDQEKEILSDQANINKIKESSENIQDLIEDERNEAIQNINNQLGHYMELLSYYPDLASQQQDTINQSQSALTLMVSQKDIAEFKKKVNDAQEEVDNPAGDPNDALAKLNEAEDRLRLAENTDRLLTKLKQQPGPENFIETLDAINQDPRSSIDIDIDIYIKAYKKGASLLLGHKVINDIDQSGDMAGKISEFSDNQLATYSQEKSEAFSQAMNNPAIVAHTKTHNPGLYNYLLIEAEQKKGMAHRNDFPEHLRYFTKDYSPYLNQDKLKQIDGLIPDSLGLSNQAKDRIIQLLEAELIEKGLNVFNGLDTDDAKRKRADLKRSLPEIRNNIFKKIALFLPGLEEAEAEQVLDISKISDILPPVKDQVFDTLLEDRKFTVDFFRNKQGKDALKSFTLYEGSRQKTASYFFKSDLTNYDRVKIFEFLTKDNEVGLRTFKGMIKQVTPTVTEHYLSAELGISEAAAQSMITMLTNLQLIDPNGYPSLPNLPRAVTLLESNNIRNAQNISKVLKKAVHRRENQIDILRDMQRYILTEAKNIDHPMAEAKKIEWLRALPAAKMLRDLEVCITSLDNQQAADFKSVKDIAMSIENATKEIPPKSYNSDLHALRDFLSDHQEEISSLGNAENSLLQEALKTNGSRQEQTMRILKLLDKLSTNNKINASPQKAAAIKNAKQSLASALVTEDILHGRIDLGQNQDFIRIIESYTTNDGENAVLSHLKEPVKHNANTMKRALVLLDNNKLLKATGLMDDENNYLKDVHPLRASINQDINEVKLENLNNELRRLQKELNESSSPAEITAKQTAIHSKKMEINSLSKAGFFIKSFGKTHTFTELYNTLQRLNNNQGEERRLNEELSLFITAFHELSLEEQIEVLNAQDSDTVAMLYILYNRDSFFDRNLDVLPKTYYIYSKLKDSIKSDFIAHLVSYNNNLTEQGMESNSLAVQVSSILSTIPADAADQLPGLFKDHPLLSHALDKGIEHLSANPNHKQLLDSMFTGLMRANGNNQDALTAKFVEIVNNRKKEMARINPNINNNAVLPAGINPIPPYTDDQKRAEIEHLCLLALDSNENIAAVALDKIKNNLNNAAFGNAANPELLRDLLVEMTKSPAGNLVLFGEKGLLTKKPGNDTFQNNIILSLCNNQNKNVLNTLKLLIKKSPTLREKITDRTRFLNIIAGNNAQASAEINYLQAMTNPDILNKMNTRDTVKVLKKSIQYGTLDNIKENLIFLSKKSMLVLDGANKEILDQQAFADAINKDKNIIAHLMMSLEVDIPDINDLSENEALQIMQIIAHDPAALTQFMAIMIQNIDDIQ